MAYAVLQLLGGLLGPEGQARCLLPLRGASDARTSGTRTAGPARGRVPASLELAKMPTVIELTQMPANLELAEMPTIIEFTQMPANLEFAKMPTIIELTQMSANLELAKKPTTIELW